jgi:predicted phosphate transport protein (TIGR00153 family)
MIRFISKDGSFFEMFSDMSDNVIAGARVLVNLFADYRDVDVEERIREIRRIEHVGDDLTHSILTKLHQTFITPFDREDIHRLASSLDDVLDLINAAGARITMYKITQPPPAALGLARIILLQSQELKSAVSRIQKNGDVLQHCVEINRLEHEADQVSQDAIGRLFKLETDPIVLIKIKELIEVLETATDKAEDAANVLETVVLKNA